MTITDQIVDAIRHRAATSSQHEKELILSAIAEIRAQLIAATR